MPDLLISWTFWYWVGGAVVAIAAGLLIAILLVARGIEREAQRALEAVRAIDTGTRAIWTLADAVDELRRIRGDAESIEGRVRHLADAVQGAAEGSVSR